MRCEVIENDAVHAKVKLRICVGCGCTDDVGCPEGCYWVSQNPPLCSVCAKNAGAMIDAGELAPGVYINDQPSGPFDQQRCPASPTPALHVLLWVDGTTGYCTRCREGFIA